MIVRIWRGLTREADAERYSDYVQQTGLKDCVATEGNRGCALLRRVGEGRAEFLFLSWWESFEAIRKFAGPELDKAVYYPEDAKFLLELEPKVAHYELLADSRDSSGPAAPVAA